MTDLKGKTAFVTGSSRGIGAAIARTLASAGARVALHGRDEAALAAIRRDLPSSIVVTGDLRERSAAARMAEQVLAEFGTLDILVANAGGSHAPPRPIEEITDEIWDADIDANLGATFRTVRAFLPAMKQAAYGSIVTIASTAGRRASALSPVPYGAAKAAVIHFTQCVAAQAGPAGIRANCVAPEAILTENNLQRIPAATQQQMVATHPIRRLGTPEDVAAAVLFLASDDAGWISGTVTDIAGGGVLV